MKAVVLRKPEDLVVQDVPKPSPGEGEALLRVIACGICGSDLRYVKGENPWAQHTIGEKRENPPNIILGHEIVGIIIEVGPGVPKDRIGERVAVLCFKVCGECHWCKAGLENLCPNTMHLGHGAGWGKSNYYYGGMAEFVPVWAEHCFPLPDSVSDEAASLLDALGVAVHAVDIAEMEPGSSVLILGAGPIGLFIMQCAALAGAKPIIVSELNKSALHLAKEYGADVCVNPKEVDLSAAVREATGIGAWTVFDTVGLPLRETMPLVASGGRLMLLAVKPQVTSISPTILSGERRIQTVANFRYDDFPTAIEDLHDGGIRTDGMVTHKFRLYEAVEAFQAAEHKEQTGAIKVLLVP